MAPIVRRKLYQEVLNRLIEGIMSGDFPPGSQMPSEKELMVRFGVGRPAVREAMLTMQQMGLVRISHGERARVTNPSADTIIGQMSSAMVMMLATSPRGLEDLKEARVMMETGLVQIAARKASGIYIEKLTDIHERLEQARGNRETFIQIDMEFHGLIAEMSGNAIIAAVVRGMLGWLTRFRTEMVSVKGAERVTVEEHARILKAIAAGDAAAAATAMSDHLSRASSLYAQFATPEQGEAAGRNA
jgi:DNA-binding FadR family transcriptional regulator